MEATTNNSTPQSCIERQILDLLKQHQLDDVKAVNEDADTVLHLAVKNEKFTAEEIIEILKILLDKRVDPSIENNNGETVLHLAITKRSKDIIDFLLSRNIEFDDSLTEYLIENEYKKFEKLDKKCKISDHEKQKIESESANFVEWLLSKGLKINSRNSNRHSNALYLTTEYNLQHILLVLLKQAKDVTFVDSTNRTLLHYFLTNKSAKNGINQNWYTKRYEAEIVKISLDRGITPDAEDNFKCTPMQIAIENNEDIKIVELLIERSTNIQRKNWKREKLFHTVICNWICSEDTESQYFMKIARILIAKGADINELEEHEKSPLVHSVEKHNVRIIEFLRENGADFKFTTKDGETLMHVLVKSGGYDEAARRKEIEIFDILISNGCPLNAQDERGVTPLHVAVNDYNKAMVQKLLEHGADVNCRDSRKETPLYYLANNDKQITMAELLLKYGANLDARNVEGFTALHATAVWHLRQLGNPNVKMLEFLLEHGADFNARTKAGHSVLHMALWYEYNRVRKERDQVEPDDLPSFVTCINDCKSYARDEVITLLKHCIKLGVAGLKCDADNQYGMIVQIPRYKSYREMCLEEMKKLESTFIDSHTSLLTLLQMDPNNRRAYIDNEKLRELIHSAKLKEQFPEYAALIMASYHEAVMRRKLLEPARKAWLELTEINLPDECIEHVLSFLSNSDLFLMIEK